MEQKKESKSFNPVTALTEQERKDWEFVDKRISQLKEARESLYGLALERTWADADRDYVPHRLKTKGKRVVAEDEDKGLRGNLVVLGSSDWQSDISQPNVFIKIQTALSLLIDQNPTGIFTPTAKQYQKTTELMRQLYQRSWEYAQSKQQLKLFVFNLSKYGWAVARTYPLRVARKVRNIIEYDPENPDNNKYEEKEIVEYNDIYRENLDVWNVWIDDMTRPNDRFSMRDWCWRKVYSMDTAEEEFGKYKNWKYVKAGGITTDRISGQGKSEKKFKESNLVEVYFYENRIKDLYMAVINGVPVVISPLPVSDAQGNKKLSCWQTYWNLRSAESPYGIGIYESLRYDQAFLDRIRNMTVDQLTLSIYKSFFYSGTNTGVANETNDIVLSPGVGKQVLNPKDIVWNAVPGPGPEAWNGIDRFKKDIDDDSGISETLQGVVTGKTAFEIAQAKESALKRLKTPLDNILDALNLEGYITVSLIQLLYSIPETFEIADKSLIDAYLQEIQSDPELFDRGPGKKFTAKVYREFPLNLDKDEKGNLVETKNTQFFRVKPSALNWEGIISIKSQSVLTPSKQVDKALELEMYNMLIPLLAQPSQIYSKIANNIVKLYDKDPKDILPDEWIQGQQQPQQQQQGQQPQGMVMGGVQAPNEVPKQAERLVTRTQVPQQPQGIAQKVSNQQTKPFRKVA